MSGLDTRQQALSAIRKSNFKAFRRLMKGKKLKDIDTGPIPLLAKCTNKAIAQLLIEKGAGLEAKDKAGKTPLFWCFQLDNAKTLVALGADVNASCHDGTSILGKAARTRNIDLLYFFIKKGAVAWSDSGNEVVTNIFENFLDVSRKLSYSGCSTADEVLLAAKHKDTKEVKYLLTLMKKNASETIKLLLVETRPLLLRILLTPAPLRQDEDCIGTNVDWNIVNGIEAVRDKDTGLKFDLDQKLFVDEVSIIIPNTDSTLKKVIKVKGALRNLFHDIHRIYQAEMKEYTRMSFQGLFKEEHKRGTYYSLDIEPEKGGTKCPYVRYEGSI
jgi:hypothetical protein